mgnify:CR=1 FL=1
MEQIKEKVVEVLSAVLPITLVVILLQFTIIWAPMEVLVQFLIGAVMVIVGLALFLIGVEVGLLPVGEMIGSALPKTKKLWMLVFFGFIFGFVVTVAEPDVRVLAMQVDQVSGGAVPKNILIYSIALGVGIFVGLAMLRIIFNISYRLLLFVSYALVFIMALFAPSHFIPVSFDSGGVTTGPITVPFIVALGVGVASVMRGKSSSADAFGLVGLASIGPIMAVMLMGVLYG